MCYNIYFCNDAIDVFYYDIILNDENVLNTTIIGRRKMYKDVDCAVQLKYNMYSVFRAEVWSQTLRKGFSPDGKYCYMTL